jgi:hypothetical protein
VRERELRDAVAALAAADVEEVVEQARADARERARSLLADAMTDALLSQAAAVLAPSPRVTREGGRGLYVFGVVRDGPYDLPAGARLMVEVDLAAVVQEVPLAEYGEEALRQNLNDIAWLEDAARRHETVLDGLLRQTTVIPLRLCTIYRSEEAVRDMLVAERAELGEALERLDGRTEWGVKAFRAPAPVEAVEDSGVAYMDARLRQSSARDRADEAVEDAFARLAALSVEALANPLQHRELTGRDDDMVLNGVHLVEDACEGDFRAAVESLQADGLTFELTGPWPPYNFVKRSVEAAR